MWGVKVNMNWVSLNVDWMKVCVIQSKNGKLSVWV